jgi:CRP-like cAMP-binding protein
MSKPPRTRLFSQAHDAISFPPGVVLFTAGDPGDYMYVVKTGEVDLIIGDEVVETAVAGTIFGELALVDSETRICTAITRTDCELVKIDEKRFTFMLQQTPYFAIEVMHTLADRLRRMDQRLISNA